MGSGIFLALKVVSIGVLHDNGPVILTQFPGQLTVLPLDRLDLSSKRYKKHVSEVASCPAPPPNIKAVRYCRLILVNLIS
jgi:hypothetical protein